MAFNGAGLKWDRMSEKGMAEVWAFLNAEWFVLMGLAIYLEATLKTGYGVKRHPLFFLQKSFWKKETKIVHTLSREEVKRTTP